MYIEELCEWTRKNLPEINIKQEYISGREVTNFYLKDPARQFNSVMFNS